MADIQALTREWQAPALPESIPQGDMPGDKICITEEHRQKAETLFPKLKQLLWETLSHHPHQRAVVAVCGGSGVGKSEIASLLSYYLNQLGVGGYTLSGDNYPHRIPRDNDAERLRVFRGGRSAGADRRGRVYPGDRRYPAGTVDPGHGCPGGRSRGLPLAGRVSAGRPPGAWENTWARKRKSTSGRCRTLSPASSKGRIPCP